MATPGVAGQVPALDLVLSLSASLHPFKTALYRKINRLIIAKFEMQELEIGNTSPIPAIERVISNQVESASNGRPIHFRDHEEHPVRHALAEQIEKRACQIG